MAFLLLKEKFIDSNVKTSKCKTLEDTMKNTLKKAALTQTTEEYASRSSIHGISYIFDRELSIVDRLIWLLVVLSFAGVAAALIWNFWSQWRNEQVTLIFFSLG